MLLYTPALLVRWADKGCKLTVQISLDYMSCSKAEDGKYYLQSGALAYPILCIYLFPSWYSIAPTIECFNGDHQDGLPTAIIVICLLLNWCFNRKRFLGPLSDQLALACLAPPLGVFVAIKKAQDEEDDDVVARSVPQLNSYFSHPVDTACFIVGSCLLPKCTSLPCC